MEVTFKTYGNEMSKHAMAAWVNNSYTSGVRFIKTGGDGVKVRRAGAGSYEPRTNGLVPFLGSFCRKLPVGLKGILLKNASAPIIML